MSDTEEQPQPSDISGMTVINTTLSGAPQDVWIKHQKGGTRYVPSAVRAGVLRENARLSREVFDLRNRVAMYEGRTQSTLPERPEYRDNGHALLAKALDEFIADYQRIAAQRDHAEKCSRDYREQVQRLTAEIRSAIAWIDVDGGEPSVATNSLRKAIDDA